MLELLNFSILDMTPYNRQAYFNLLEYYNQSIWPLHILTVLITSWLLYSWSKSQQYILNIILVIFAIVWIANGYLYHQQYYLSLNWAAEYFGYLFMVQGIFFFMMAIFLKVNTNYSELILNSQISYFLLVLALIIYPLSGFIEGRSFIQLESFALTPTPIVLASLALILKINRKAGLVLSFIPLIWSVISMGLSWKIQLIEFYIIVIGLSVFILCFFFSTDTIKIYNTENPKK